MSTATPFLTDDVNVCLGYAGRRDPLHLLGDVELAQGHQTGHHVAVRQLQDAKGIPLLDGGVVCVEVLKEGQESLESYARNFDLGGIRYDR